MAVILRKTPPRVKEFFFESASKVVRTFTAETAYRVFRVVAGSRITHAVQTASFLFKTRTIFLPPLLRGDLSTLPANLMELIGNPKDVIISHLSKAVSLGNAREILQQLPAGNVKEIVLIVATPILASSSAPIGTLTLTVCAISYLAPKLQREPDSDRVELDDFKQEDGVLLEKETMEIEEEAYFVVEPSSEEDEPVVSVKQEPPPRRRWLW